MIKFLAFSFLVIAFATAIRADMEEESFGFFCGMVSTTMVVCADLLIRDPDAKKKDSPK